LNYKGNTGKLYHSNDLLPGLHKVAPGVSFFGMRI